MVTVNMIKIARPYSPGYDGLIDAAVKQNIENWKTAKIGEKLIITNNPYISIGGVRIGLAEKTGQIISKELMDEIIHSQPHSAYKGAVPGFYKYNNEQILAFTKYDGKLSRQVDNHLQIYEMFIYTYNIYTA